ncbi:hypothetical protein DUNSADRAFT_11855 [Dunaliella salina]|uniref:Uncharacterized protein n=1 Tax=Dunaliella salina TaxID=3046 RepID=A0ABQ7GCE9_DUNSA|nr:hypothetical protein DUNSADRAFT_11855 [Dunaliella salina]|eukprot:KAF5832290.1 hypothetical protein DUNSADRAFT_11855 [Dunaliella salina]
MAHTTTPQGHFLPLHALRNGPAPEGSSGIQVASMAGLPPRLCAQAHKVAARLFQQLQQRQHPAAPCLDTLLDRCQGGALPMSAVEVAAFKDALKEIQQSCGARLFQH